MRSSPSRHFTTPEPGQDRPNPPETMTFYPSVANLKAGSSYTSYTPPERSNITTAETYTRATSSSPPPHTNINNGSGLKHSDSDSDLPALVPVVEEYWHGEHHDWQAVMASSLPSNVMIDGRDEKEELNWWDERLRAEQARPGPGILPVLAKMDITGVNQVLYKVNIQRPSIPQSLSRDESPSSSSSAPTMGKSSAHFTPPTDTEFKASVPHPEALYNPDKNEWRMLNFTNGPLRNLTPNLSATLHGRLPDEHRRLATTICVGLAGYGQTNLSHHLHTYVNAVNVKVFEPHFTGWGGGVNADSTMENASVEDDENLDLLVCCQCSFYCIASKPLRGVIGSEHLAEVVKDKLENPGLGMSGPYSAASALEVLLKAVENNVWKGEERGLSITGKAFQKLGWNAHITSIFESLMYTLPAVGEEKPAAKPPSMASPEIRTVLLRAWVELSCYFAVFLQRYKPDPDKFKCFAEVQDATPTIDESLGCGPEILTSRSVISQSQATCWGLLGLPLGTASADLIEFAYRSQCRCDPAQTPQYLISVQTIASCIRSDHREQSAALEGLVVTEISRGRWTDELWQQATVFLGFGKDNVLKLDWNADIEDEFALHAWKDALRRAWSDHDSGAQRRKELNDALRILAEERGSIRIMEEMRNNTMDMDPDQAYRILEVPRDVEEDMLLMVYSMRVEEQPSQVERMKHAMMVIAEFTDSARLRKFMQTGVDGGDQSQQHPLDWPRGLNQLGNTCYLNSLLQYFFTIKDLREAVAPLRSLEQEKGATKDMSNCRVGGRFVSQREVHRSQAFVSQLANLFTDMECSSDLSVTPSLELAKLALVTSKDEEDDEISTRPDNTDSSNSTDATLVEESLPALSSLSNSAIENTSSILGKRGRADAPSADITINDGDVDMQDAATSLPVPPPLPPRRKSEVTTSSVMMFGKQHDVAECMDNCLFQIEAALLGRTSHLETVKDSMGIVKSLFYGKLRQRVTPLRDESKASGSTHTKDDVFSHLPVNVSLDSCDLYDGLGAYFEDTVEFDGHGAQMDVTLVDLPPILQIQLQRVQFDRKTSQAFKSHAFVQFPETLAMDRFLEDADSGKRSQSQALQRQISQCRDRLTLLTQGALAPYDEHLATSSAFLKRLKDVDVGDIPEFLRTRREGLSSELEDLRSQLATCKEQVESLWADDRHMEYELTSVFIHRGVSPSFGHYFFYTRYLPDNPDSWFKLNDSEVSMVSKGEVFADSTNSTANAYLLVYAKKGSGVIEMAKRNGKPGDIPS